MDTSGEGTPIRQTLERVSEGVVALDSDRSCTYANQRALELLETSHGELVGEPLSSVLPETAESLGEQIENAVEKGTEATYEYGAEGTSQWFEIRIYPDDDGASILFEDITERKQREQQIERVHETTRTLITADTRQEVAEQICAAANRILDVDACGVHFYDEAAGGLTPVAVSESARELLGDVPVLDNGLAWDVYRSGEEQVFGDVRDASGVYDADTAMRSEIFLPLGDDGVLILSSTRVDAFDASDETVAKLLASNAGAVLGELEKEQQLRERDREIEQAEKLFENAQDAFFVVDVGDTEFRIKRVNPAYELLTGLQNDEIAGRTIRDIFGEDDSGAINDRYSRCVSQREPIDYVETLDVPEPDSYWETHIAPVVVDDEVVQLVGTTRNITERKTRERRIEEQRDKLELLNEMVRHDIRNDLQIVSTYAELLVDRVDEDDRTHVEKIRESARSAVELTRTARDLAGTMLQTDENLEPVSLKSALSTQVNEIRTTHSEAVIRVEGTVPSVTVMADDMLPSVFRNTIKNAIEHNDSAVPEVTITATTPGERVRVTIADNGPGIPDDQKDAVFGRGEKGLESEGTGIGLYLVDTLVTRYGGQVRIDNNEPDGAIVSVVLQRADADA